jgi:hypothetical protein
MQRIYENYDITAQHDLHLIDLLQGEIDFEFFDDDDTQDEELNHFFD